MMSVLRQRISRDERAAQEELKALRERRRNRFRVLVCIDGSQESYEGLQFASEISRSDECDVILLYVRRFDQGLRTGGLQMRVARENMLEWGFDMPGIGHLKRGLEMLTEKGLMQDNWESIASRREIRGDPVGDHKVEYRNKAGKSIVLKLKTAATPASGILDQYELGPYNLIILGAQHRWQGDLRSLFDPGVTQKVAMLAPCSTLVTRRHLQGDGMLICVDGSEHALDSARRAAVLAEHIGEQVSLISVIRVDEDARIVEDQVAESRAAIEEIGIGVKEAKTCAGDPVAEIIREGSPYKLIVVSDSGKSRLKRFWVGSVAFGVMGHSDTSVLNVR